MNKYNTILRHEIIILFILIHIFYLILFAGFPSLQVNGALANEIKHDNSPVGIVVLDPG